jgi:hypothetical protein
VSILLAGNSYTRVLRGPDGSVIALRNLDPMRIEPRLNAEGFVEFVWDHTTIIPAEDIIHVTDIRRPGAIKG